MNTILIVEDKESLREVLKKTLSTEGYGVDEAADGKEALARIGKKKYDLVLTDLKLPHADGHDVLKASMDADSNTPVIVMTAYGTIEDAVQAMKEGAYDYLSKPVDTDHLLLLINRALEQKSILAENIILKEAFAEKLGFPQIIGEDKKILAVENQIKKIAPTDATVLLMGESGTGKELFARAIHDLSKRKEKPFVAINCAAIPETLLENELFGHEKGAYTGAYSSKMGKFEMAHRGTLFLDEIGDLSHNVQVKLLRVIETKQFERVGGTRTVEVDVRIVAATNKDLKRSVQEKAFREDLYFRISVVPVIIPPLQERPSDIPPLVKHFAEKFAREFKKKKLTVSEEAVQLLQKYPWPGNVRELENCIERAAILVEGEVIEPQHLNLQWDPSKSKGQKQEGKSLLAYPGEMMVLESALRSGSLEESKKQGIETAEKIRIMEALKEADRDGEKASELLDISEKELSRKMKEYKLDR
jgi:DNA-binding NtrC family response regulator